MSDWKYKMGNFQMELNNAPFLEMESRH